ncbi:MAG: hypothetical protein ABJC36_14025 [Gemmatimonadales bacterium]
MNRTVSRRLNMAVRVRDFCETNPSADPSFVSVLGRLKEAIDRMVSLGSRQVSGLLSRHASTVNRQQIRRGLRNDLLRHLVTIAQDAAAEKPGLGDQFEIPGHNLSSARFYAVAKAMLELGVAEKEVLIKHGLSDQLLNDLAVAVAEFEGSITATNTSREEHIGARAELQQVSDEVLQLVQMMNGINRYRFRGDPHLLVAWEAAKHVVSGPQVKSEAPAAPEAPSQPGTGGQTEEVKPAA